MNDVDTVNIMRTQKEYISQYEQYLMVDQAKSKNTVVNYVSDLKQYFSKFDVIDRENIQKFKEYLRQELNLSITTINRKLSSVKSFNQYLVTLGLIDQVKIIKRDFYKVQDKGNPTTLTRKQVDMFLNRVETKDNMYKSRNIALVHLISATGIRREEACNITIKSLDFDNHLIVGLVGKGDKERDIILCKEVIPYIKNYLKDREKMKYADSPFLFISERGWKLHKDTINDIFDDYCTPKLHITPHMLRHSYATNTVEQGVLTLPELKDQLGHSHINTVGIYAKARRENIRMKIDKLQYR